MNEITAAQLPALTATVLWSAFALAVVFGAVAQRTNFCTMGGIADLVNFGDSNRLRQWLLAIGVAIAATSVLAATGIIDTTKTIYAAPRFTWLSYILGGLLFGFGMVLAGGCGSRTLVRLGGGSLKSLVVAVMLGLFAYITLRGALGVARVTWLDPVQLQFASSQDLPALLARAFGLSRGTLLWVLGLGFGGALIAFALAPREFRNFDNLLAGFAIGAVIAGVWYVSGHLGHLAEHPETLEETYLATNSGRMESLSYVAPIAYTLDWLMLFSDKSKVLSLGIVAVFGIVLGSAVVALVSRSFRWEGFANTEDTANHLVGGALMGFGGVTGLGCTIGQGLSGVSTLALGSFLALGSIATGAVLALKYQAWRVEKMC
jgi:uncharacterized membrane protein YedE/YeeE